MMVNATTNGIQISVSPFYQDKQSNPAQGQYVFSYQILIENLSDHAVQLIDRHWIIFDSLGPRREIKGEGVVGQQPIIEPGKSHSYQSWCPLNSDIGYMEGSFGMIRLDNDARFEAEVPRFDLMADVRVM